MDKPKYQVGDIVWTGEWKPRNELVLCPDCGGTKTLRVILFDGTEYVLECDTCGQRAWHGPTGYVQTYRYAATAIELMVKGLSSDCFGRDTGWQYSLGAEHSATCCRSSVPESEIFLDEQAALEFAYAKGRQLAINSDAQFVMKEKPNKKWSWHVSYHRQTIARLEKDLAYHRRKLQIARDKAKEDK